MKATIFTIVPLLFLFVGSVLASPVAVSTADEQDLAARQFIELDLIVNVLYSDVQVTNKFYNTTCAEKCSPVYVVEWAKKVSFHCYDAVAKCKQLPSGYRFLNLGLIVKLVVALLVEIQYTLKFLLAGCGIPFNIGVLGLVGNLIIALNLLLKTLARFVFGLLPAILVLLLKILGGGGGCGICELGLKFWL
ncbi:hypothetical protein BZA05DRAFT_421257 [Tricharina praecox]|uniref:uncharacterized protein n=1 Tax=Tricharina praecox TaxID=43433 RepID=UPI0022210D5E|nr:uncharacterized protein BZA05DRAFT_421257 [Tricharina praecox]KAI5846013.1 hypothetical protein BZA05DRAFT_421257 [Tricharina praecox]